jgi:hypothetical protein
VVRERSAKPLYVGSIPTRASIKSSIKTRVLLTIRRFCTEIARHEANPEQRSHLGQARCPLRRRLRAGSKLPHQPSTEPEARGKAKSKRARPVEGDYTVSQLAEEWGFSTDKIRELFRNEPGVLKMKDEKASKKRKRSYVTLRIPPELAQRVKRRLS